MKENKRSEKNELISVVIPMYNAEDYIRECLESVCRQRYSYWECVVVDDGSSDRSCQVVMEMAEMDSRIRLLQIPHQGVSYAVKAGVLEAKGQWIYFADSDDWIDEDELAVLYGHVHTTGCDMVAANYILEKGRPKKVPLVRFDGLVRREDFSQKLFSHLLCKVDFGGLVCGNTRSGKLIKRELVVQNVEYQIGLRFGEDAILMLAALLDSKTVVGDREHYGYHYRVQEKSSSSNYGIASGRFRMEYMIRVKMLLEEKEVFEHPVLQDNYRQFLLIFLVGIFRRVEFDEKKLYQRYPEMEAYITDALDYIMTGSHREMGLRTRILLWLLKKKQHNALQWLYRINRLKNYGWEKKADKRA